MMLAPQIRENVSAVQPHYPFHNLFWNISNAELVIPLEIRFPSEIYKYEFNLFLVANNSQTVTIPL